MWCRGLTAVLLRAVSVRHANGQQDAQRQASPHAEAGTPQGQHHSEGEAREQPAWLQVAVLLFCWGVFVMFTLLLSHYPRCSSQYWAIFGVQGAACLAAEALFIHLVSISLALLLASSMPIVQTLQCTWCHAGVWHNVDAAMQVTCLACLCQFTNLRLCGMQRKGAVCFSCTELTTHLDDVQVRNRKARQATSSLKQPMLQSAYSEPPSWTLTRLVRSAVITLVSGIIAGQMPF